VEALAGLAAGTLTPEPQDEARATYHSWPEARDYVIDATWTVERALSFASGVFRREEPVILVARDGTRFRLIEPIGGVEGVGVMVDVAWRLNDEVLGIGMVDGEFLGLAERLESTGG
jgi:hypothetical protein